MTEVVTHYWGDYAKSPCGLNVSLAYSTNNLGFTSSKEDVNCPECKRILAEKRCRWCGQIIQKLFINPELGMQWLHTPPNSDAWTDACPRPPQTYASPKE